MGHTAEVIGPDRFRTLPCPTYPDIRLSLLPRRSLARMVDAFAPDALHISTEGPLGIAARAWRCGAAGASPRRSTPASRNTCTPAPGCRPALSYAWLRRFHGAGSGLMVATESLRAGAGRPRLPQHPRLVARRGPGRVPAGAAGGVAVSAPGVRLCRPGRGGEEHRRVPGAGPARQQGGGGRRPGPRVAAAALSRTRISSACAMARRCRRVRRVGRVRVPVADRHVRPGAAGEPGLRHPGRRLPGDRPADVLRRAAPASAPPTPTCAPPPCAPWPPATARPAAPMPTGSRGGPAPSRSCTTWCRWRSRRWRQPVRAAASAGRAVRPYGGGSGRARAHRRRTAPAMPAPAPAPW